MHILEWMQQGQSNQEMARALVKLVGDAGLNYDEALRRVQTLAIRYAKT